MPTSDRDHPYDFEGGNLATAPNEDPEKAYIWDALLDTGIAEMNTESSPMAAESKALHLLGKEDQAPERELNEAIWKSVKGSTSEMPTPLTQFQIGLLLHTLST